ncbi:hypothetical protein K474DRAFT_1696387 [Panus rudis PR-1116 ss-1]|nr:hypothetical protein K474DRAFT_1696387 [Panus rudis PR-1116 ss-1]
MEMHTHIIYFDMVLDLFMDHRLNRSGLRRGTWDCPEIQRLTQTFQTTSHHGTIEEICRGAYLLLNALSLRIHHFLTNQSTPLRHRHPLRFLDHHRNPLVHPHKSFAHYPHLVGIFAGKETQFQYVQSRGRRSIHSAPYYQVETVVEWHPESVNSEHIGRLGRDHLSARPDLPLAYVLSLSPGGYYLTWLDASGGESTPLIPYSNLEPLAYYIHTLYKPYARGVPLFDPSIRVPTRCPKTGDIVQRISDGRHEMEHPIWYSRCKEIYTGVLEDKRTTVWHSSKSGRDDDNDFVIIKDVYQVHNKRYDEGDILRTIHEYGVVPGVVRLVHAGSVTREDGQPMVLSWSHDHVVRKRLVLGSKGSKLSDAKTMKDALMAIYDALEVSRALYEQAGIDHRDLSPNNVLMYPKHRKSDKGEKEILMKDPPTCIGEILKLESTPEDGAQCLIIDFDGATDMCDEKAYVSQYRQIPFGTKAFASRSAVVGCRLTDAYATSYVPMPKLEGKARKLYVAHYGKGTYLNYLDKPGGKTIHGGINPRKIWLEHRLNEARAVPIPFEHKFHHDAESLFWILYSTCVEALPQGEDPELSPDYYDWLLAFFQQSREGEILDIRSSILNFSVEEFQKRCLHSKLASLGPLLHALAQQVRPEYAYLPIVNESHLHEAMRRILLDFLVKMEDPIPLTPGQLRSRTVHPILPPRQAKRKRNDDIEENTPKAKKTRTRRK